MRTREYVTPSLPGGIRIKWTREFDMDVLYKKMKYWLDDYGFGANLEEEEYSEAIKGDSKELRIKWYAERPEGSYFGFVIEVVFLVLNLKDVMVRRENREFKINQADFEVRMHAYVVKDAQDKYNKQTQWVYENLLVRNRIFEKKRDLHQLIYKFSDEVKKQLQRY